MSKPYIIRLGPQWAQFTYEREEFELLGTIQCEAQIGALARQADGTFVQLNGDWTVPLSAARVRAALRQAESRPSAGPRHGARPAKPASAAPVVVVRKRRRVPQPSQA